jgi:hypothetical protein
MAEVSLSPTAKGKLVRHMYISFEALREDFIGRVISCGLWLPRFPYLTPCNLLWFGAILKLLKPEEESTRFWSKNE